MVCAGLMAGFACGCKYLALPMVVLPLAIAAFWQRGDSRVGWAQPIRCLALFLVGAAVAFSPWLARNLAWTGNPVFPLARGVFHERLGAWDDDGAARWHAGHLPAPQSRSASGRLRRLWTEVLAAPLYGPLPLLGAVSGAVLILLRMRTHRHSSDEPPRRDETPGASPPLASCGLITLGALVTWLGFTHLEGRFAVVVIIPAALLVGVAAQRVVAASPPLPSVPMRIGLAALLGAWLLTTAWTLVGVVLDSHAPALLPLSRRERLAPFLDEPSHVARINEITRSGGRVLMVGDARRFYLDAGVDYSVVFNPNPFAEAARAHTAEQLIEWLQGRGYGHVYVDWAEMHRLRTTRYGFWQSLDVPLFERLTAAGLEPIDAFPADSRRPPFATLFRVPSQSSGARGTAASGWALRAELLVVFPPDGRVGSGPPPDDERQRAPPCEGARHRAGATGSATG